ncbi:ATP-binding cassette sub-family A member 7-like [Amblyomma americanum]
MKPKLPDPYLLDVSTEDDVVAAQLSFAKEHFRFFVFGVLFGLQMVNETSGTLWYNGEIRHGAPLLMTLYNEARLQYVTGLDDAVFRFEVKELDYGSHAPEDENTVKQSVYREVLPKVLRSIFLPMVSSLMCSNFVLFPISERAMQVKHLHVVAGVSPTLYWATSFLWDFMFYMGTAIFVLPPIAYFQSKTLYFTHIQQIFLMNILHGFAALPFIYVCSFCFDNPGFGFSTLAIATFLISSLCCLGSVFMEHYAATLESFPLTVLLEFVLQIARLLPNYSYSRGMMKLMQLAAENAICKAGGETLISECQARTIEAKKSVKQCCQHQTEPDPSKYAIGPLDVHPYSVFFEVVTLVVEGPLLFLLILVGERYWLRQLYRHLTEPLPEEQFQFEPQPVVQGLRVGKASKAAKHEDTDVVKEDKLVAGMVYQQQPAPENMKPAMIVCRLKKAYGYTETNLVLQSILRGTNVYICGGPLDGTVFLLVIGYSWRELGEGESAGNKRKLSLCIAMIGMPKVVLLDEPYASIGTTSRKRIVNYISALQRVAKFSIILTSHSMSDVEFLCNRIAILGGGKLQCLGSLAHLKDKFGKGYTITVKTYPDRKEDFDYQREVAQTVRKVFRQAELVHSYEGLLEFRMSRVRMLWSDMFAGMAQIKKRFKLQDFFITDTSLEQIFLSVTRKEASEAAAAAAAEPPKIGATTTLGI